MIAREVAILWTGNIVRIAERFAPAALLVLAVAFGGASSGTPIATGISELVAIALMLVVTLDPRYATLSNQARLLIGLAAALVLWSLIQLIPLPANFWVALPGRENVENGFRLLGLQNLPALPISLEPESTLAGILRFIPPFAMFVLVAKSPSPHANTILIWAILALAVGSTVFGMAQVLEPSIASPYAAAGAIGGPPAGLFANVNHQADFQLLAIPFAAVLLSRISLNRALGDSTIGLALVVGAGALVLIIGVLASGSLAGYGLLGPTLIVSALIYINRPFGPRLIAATVAGLVGLGALGAWLATSEVPALFGVASADSDALSRPQVFDKTLKAVSDHWPWGTGIGSFERVYPAYEDASVVTNVYTNHVHNDYFELALELGLPGLILLAAIIAFLLVRASFAWTGGGQDSRLKKAAAAGLIVILIHSTVDYPLRTLSIATVAALFAGLLMQSRRGAATTELVVSPQHKQLVL